MAETNNQPTPSPINWMESARSQRSRLALSAFFLVVLIGLAAYTLQKAPLQEIGAAIGRAKPAWLMAGVALLALGQGLRFARWWRILNWEARPDTPETWFSLMGGQVLNWLLPVRLGEVWRIWEENSKKRNSLLWVAGSIIVEKSGDSLALALMSVALVFVPLPTQLPTGALRALATAFAGFLMAGGLVAFRSSAWQTKVLQRFPQFGGVVSAMRPTESHTEQLRNPLNWLEGVAWSISIWAIAILTNVVVARAFGLALGAGAHLTLMLAIMSVLAIAATPANAGMPVVVAATLALFGVAQADAIAFGSVLYGLTYGVNLLLLGISWLVRKGGQDKKLKIKN